MAVFGNLKEMPLSEVLTMVSRGMGRFCIHHHPTTKEFVLFVRHGSLIGLQIDAAPVHDILDVRLWLAELLRSEEGEFEFVRTNSLDLASMFALPLDQLLLSSFSELVEEQTFCEHFPDPQTVFEMSGHPAVWMDQELESFVDKAGPLLRDGACGNFLAAAVAQPLDHVLLCLYKLRSTGHISPRRAYIKGRLTFTKTHAAADSALGLSLVVKPTKPHLNDFVDIPHALTSAEAGQEPVSANGANFESAQEGHGYGIINRLISGIRKTFGIYP